MQRLYLLCDRGTKAARKPGGRWFAVATEFAEALLDWFAEHGRHDLPWQHPRSAYRVWVSEVMLQQTRVAVVIDYFLRFMQRFPDLNALADATQDEVLEHWAGLGYYARARNLHAAAQRAVKEHQAGLPADLHALMDLPGIGRSTAGAILSLAFDQPVSILDGNAKRVYARYFAVAGFPGKAKTVRRLWQIADRHTPMSQPAAYTQAIMDLGATLCVRNNPLCERCPLQQGCQALAENAVARYPYPKPARKRPLRHTCMLVLRDGDKVLLEKRPPAGIWGGLWSLPELPETAAADAYCRQQLGLQPDAIDQRSSVRHAFTHFELEIRPLIAQTRPSADRVMQNSGHVWYKLGALPALPAPIKRLLQQLPK